MVAVQSSDVMLIFSNQVFLDAQATQKQPHGRPKRRRTSGTPSPEAKVSSRGRMQARQIVPSGGRLIGEHPYLQHMYRHIYTHTLKDLPALEMQIP